MEFTMTVTMNNTAFKDEHELPRCIERVAAVVEAYQGSGKNGVILDANGNRVGSWEIK